MVRALRTGYDGRTDYELGLTDVPDWVSSDSDKEDSENGEDEHLSDSPRSASPDPDPDPYAYPFMGEDPYNFDYTPDLDVSSAYSRPIGYKVVQCERLNHMEALCHLNDSVTRCGQEDGLSMITDETAYLHE